ncbi:MAG: DUF3572 domain-containing protein [Paracoccaceae bacterium]|nr:DUF3572 domain-containing protein [Paracoccaceae bacterium]
MNRQPMARDSAETLALQALGWIAADDEMAGRFLASAGAAPGDLRARAGDPEFLGFVLDFLLADEQSLVAFTASAHLPPDAPMRARAALPGGDLPNWT